MPGVYISYPFCAQKCTYCNFASGVFPRELEPRYVNALVSEIVQHDWPWQPETVYLGGGTPSGMAASDLDRILRSLPDGRGSELPGSLPDGRGSVTGGPTEPRASASGRHWKEATIEAAPGGISEERAAAWVRAGINRVSLGVQSFVAA